jgi:hypothetical protein
MIALYYSYLKKVLSSCFEKTADEMEENPGTVMVER